MLTAEQQEAVRSLREVVQGSGGRVIRLVGPPEGQLAYAGIRRPPTPHMLEAVLILMNGSEYDEVAIFSAPGTFGGTAYDFRIPKSKLRPNNRFLGWKASYQERDGEGGADEEAQGDRLARLANCKKNESGPIIFKGGPNVPWVGRVVEVLKAIGKYCGTPFTEEGWQESLVGEGKRVLVFLDAAFLQVKETGLRKEQEHLTAHYEALLPDSFAQLPSVVNREGSTVDLVVLCRSECEAEALVGKYWDRNLVTWRFEHHQELFPPLAWKAREADKVFLPGLEAKKPFGDLLGKFPDDYDCPALYQAMRERSVQPPWTVQAALKNLVGMEELGALGEKVEDLKGEIEACEAVGNVEDMPRLHCLFLGPTGTGKTLAAETYGLILAESGLITGNKFTKVTKKDLISQYVGWTGGKTDELCRRAMDGVLFIDEAYGLDDDPENRGAGYGKQAIDELLIYLDDPQYRRRLAVVAAGYEKEMERFLALNEGLEGRFGTKIVFKDYTEGELCEILFKMLERRNWAVDDKEKVRRVAMKAFTTAKAAYARAGKPFPNGRLAEQFIELARGERNKRLRGREVESSEYLNLNAQDFAAVVLEP